MFKLPRARLYGTSKSSTKKVDSLDVHGELFGSSSEIASKFLQDTGESAGCTQSPLTERLKKAVFDRDDRKAYVERALGYLKSKQLRKHEQYDVILVGAGLHSATYLWNFKKRNPLAKLLIVEKASTVCSTFAELGDSLVLNSPTYARVGLNSNIVPGHFVQTSDFDELVEKPPYPTAKHLFELAVMVFFHSDANIVFDFEVADVAKEDDAYLLRAGDCVFSTRNLIVANGMGDPTRASFLSQASSEKVLFGDEFIAKCHNDEPFAKSLVDTKMAVIGDGDTANCVLEYILPTLYPNKRYGFYRADPELPKLVYWIGQEAKSLKEFYFTNKSRYGHAGGIIEIFWDGDTSLEMPEELWSESKKLMKLVPEKLVSLAHESDRVLLTTSENVLEVDLVVDCTGRHNPLSSDLLRDGYETVEGDIVFYGGYWSEELESFSASPRVLKSKRLACKLKGENIFFLGGACPLGDLIDDSEARNGASKYQESRVSLTNSKWSLEHTLPRSAALAEQHAAQTFHSAR